MALEKWQAHTNLFPALKEKWVVAPKNVSTKDTTSSNEQNEETKSETDETFTSTSELQTNTSSEESTQSSNATLQLRLLPRYLCIARQRLLVLEAHPTDLGMAVVKSNHHVSELAKLTYSKREPNRITLWRRQQNEDGNEEELVERSYRLENAAAFQAQLVDIIRLCQ
jgi:hypothetical protein